MTGTERTVAAFEVRAVGDTPGAFEGYGAVFGNIDSYGDTIARGAFKETLREWRAAKKLPPMLLQHGGFLGVNAEDLVPIGKWTAMKEDSTGLEVSGRLIAMDTERGKSVYAAMKEGVLDGLSIGFRTQKFSLGTKPGDPERTLEQVDLVEVSLVTFPANPAARVADVKGASMSERDLERLLREAGGFSRDHAKQIVSKGYRACLREAGARDLETLTAELRAIMRALPQGA